MIRAHIGWGAVDFGASEGNDVKTTSDSGLAIRGPTLFVVLLATAAGCGGDESPTLSTNSGPHVVVVSDVASFQACSADTDCHLLWGGCDCYPVNQQVSRVDEQQMMCAVNSCEGQVPVVGTACVSGRCAKAFDGGCVADNHCKLVTGACPFGSDAQACVCGAVNVSITRVDRLVGPDGTCLVNNGVRVGQVTASCNTAIDICTFAP
jgi:hypothetical protein